VTVAGRVATKAATAVDGNTSVLVAEGDEDDWASRGAHKLIGALDVTGVLVAGRRALDAGASTGGFTDVLLRRGAASVLAVDVGDGQLLPRLRHDERVRVLDNTNVRELAVRRVVDRLGGPAEVIVADLSFISLTLVLPALAACADSGADLLPMVKPQFEVGRGRVGTGGVVRDPALRAQAVTQVAERAAALGWGTVAVAPSPLPGPSGNVEYFLHLRADSRREPLDLRDRVRRAVEEGPQ